MPPPSIENLSSNIPQTSEAHPCDGRGGGEFPPGLLHFPQILIFIEQVLGWGRTE